MTTEQQIAMINKLKDELLKQDDTQESSKWSCVIDSLLAFQKSSGARPSPPHPPIRENTPETLLKDNK